MIDSYISRLMALGTNKRLYPEARKLATQMAARQPPKQLIRNGAQASNLFLLLKLFLIFDREKSAIRLAQIYRKNLSFWIESQN
jgi:hypothetical protein